MSTFNRVPRTTNRASQLTIIYQRYIRMGFTPNEARMKTITHHAEKR
mgnify:CR=1 FL=1